MEAIESHALIGDCRSAALVSRTGAIDWLCWPRFDSPSLFGALLDDSAGAWTLRPAGGFRSERWYIPETNVLQTRFTTATGTILLTDLMPVASEEDKRRQMVPDHALLRQVRCEAGSVDLELSLQVEPCYRTARPRRVQVLPRLGVRFELEAGLLVLRTELPIWVDPEGRVRALHRLHAGQTVSSSLTFTQEWPAILPPLGPAADACIERSCAWWRAWSGRLRYDGPWRASVVRSALVLKLLEFAHSGAIVAAPTTSLPEWPGAELNWDYRFCWLRDAALTARALFGLGCRDEVESFVSWLLHSTRLTQPRLRILYDVFGRAPAPERVLGHLGGYRGARPVRVGNAAAGQLQLDVYGEVIDAAAQLTAHGGRLDRGVQRTLLAWGRYVCRNWERPDEGIWEPRSGRAHHTHSRLLCWVALDRLLALSKEGHLRGADLVTLGSERARIRAQLEAEAWNPRLQSYVATLGGDEVDASLLLIGWYGFEPASSERMRRTLARIDSELQAGPAQLYRYRTDPGGREGAFGICSFWAVECLAMAGSLDEAVERFEALCRQANDVGLYAEELDPRGGGALGNFPQAFTHVGLVNAALTLQERLARRPVRPSPRAAAPAGAPQAWQPEVGR